MTANTGLGSSQEIETDSYFSTCDTVGTCADTSTTTAFLDGLRVEFGRVNKSWAANVTRTVIGILAVVFASCTGSSTSNDRARVEFRLADLQQAPGLAPARVKGEIRLVYLHPEVELDDRDFETVEVVRGRLGEPVIQLKLRSQGLNKIRNLTTKHQSKILAIVVDGQVVSAPYIYGPQADEFLVIEGRFTDDEANELAHALRRSK